MLTDLIVENYQSLKQVKLRLGRFTVITGATGSGKSAVFRALRLGTFNARGTSYITQGEASTTVGLGCQEEGWATAITRGGRGQDGYRVSVLNPENADGEPKVWEYTKLAGKVPHQVSQLINLDEINFASQFGGPYLLTDVSGGDVARVFGKLTNVTLIFSAAREAVRRRKALAADLKAAEAELGRLDGERARFTTLPQRYDACQQAEAALLTAWELETRTERLRSLLGSLEAAQEALAAVPVPEVPSLEQLEELYAQRQQLFGLITDQARYAENAVRFQLQASAHRQGAEQAEQEIHKLLRDAGTCPLCGSQVPA